MNSRALITPHLDDPWVTQIARNVTLPRALLTWHQTPGAWLKSRAPLKE
jgi:hypothetical protein